MARLVIVSNRLPVTVKFENGNARVQRSPGGLATGLSGPHAESGGLWIGWPGDTSQLSDTQKQEVQSQLDAERLVPVHLTREEVDGYYEGFSNRVLWPLFHYLVDHVPLETMEWELYRSVNEKFADRVASQLRPGDTVWVHDYQLCLVPALLRQRVPNARIGFFLHIPFPAPEVLQALPWRNALLEGLLGADQLGFHTFRYQENLAEALRRLLALPAEANRVSYQGRTIRLGTYPMGIDARAFAADAQRAEVITETQRIRAEARGARILLGIDRLDYTKGIRRRLLALERLLERNPRLHGKVKLIQIAVPSRTTITDYAEFRQDVDESVGRINGAFSTTGWVPVHYLYRSFSQHQLVSLYAAADAMLITPLRDGMNLVAKEFVASRVDEQGVLLLSELAGAAAELPDALLVNPYDVDGLADAMRAALRMPAEEQRERMQRLRTRVFGWDVHRWVATFLDDLERAEQHAPLRERQLSVSPAPRLEALLRTVERASSCALFLDLDGTLVPIAPRPELVEADHALRRLLAGLAELPGTTVHVVSGRPREKLEEWFGDLPLSLHAEHGLWSRPVGEAWAANTPLNATWKQTIRPLLEDWCWRTPGAFVEEKSAGLAWHYRPADLEHGLLRAAELQERLAAIADELGVEVLEGDAVVEVRMRGVNKGLALRHAPPEAMILALGDDRTDEDLFRALPRGGLALHVGPRDSIAPFRLAGVAEARAFLRRLIEDRAGEWADAGAHGPH